MNKKENKGGFLTNEQVEQEGSQDTGDRAPRQFGNDVQQRDWLSEEQNKEE